MPNLGLHWAVAIALAAAGSVLGAVMLAAPVRRPPPVPGSTAIMCHADEPGRRLLIDGVVVNVAGKPVEGAAVTAYNTDASGLYNPPNGNTRVPRINAKVTTDAAGRFQVLTVYPGPYPEGKEPAHVHFDAIAPTFKLSYATIWIEGDPLITAERRAWAERDDETRIVPAENIEGLAIARVTIVLKEN